MRHEFQVMDVEASPVWAERASRACQWIVADMVQFQPIGPQSSRRQPQCAVGEHRLSFVTNAAISLPVGVSRKQQTFAVRFSPG